MKIRSFIFAIHGLVWVFLLVIPYVSTDQVFTQLVPGSGVKYLLLSVALSAVLLAAFYFNYYVLLPKFLLKRKYWAYFLFLSLTIATVLGLSGTIFLISDFNPGGVASN